MNTKELCKWLRVNLLRNYGLFNYDHKFEEKVKFLLDFPLDETFSKKKLASSLNA